MLDTSKIDNFISDFERESRFYKTYFIFILLF